MKPRNELSVAKWPFFLADGIVVAAAGVTLWFAASPPSPASVVVAVVLLLAGALISLVPYGIEFYWNWWQVEAEMRERSEAQQQSMAKIGAEIKAWLSRCEKMNLNPASSPGAPAEVTEGLEEVGKALAQWEERLEKREGKFAAEMEEYLRAEGEQREEFRQYLEQTLNQLVDFCGAPPVSSDHFEPESEPETELNSEEVVEPGTALPEPEPEPEEMEGLPEVDMEPDELEGEAQSLAASGESAEMAPPPRKRKSSTPKTQLRDEGGGALFSTTTLVATAFIGASNKLYLRGEGPGLSWDEGVPMNFVEIGKWSWTTTEASGAIRIQVLKNDEEEDKSGILVVEPGQTLSLRPEF